MTSYEFVIWLKGFTEACNDYTATPKQWDRIKEVLDEVEDYEEDNGLDLEIDDFEPKNHKSPYHPPYYVGDPPGWLSPYSGTPLIWNPTILSGTVSVLNSGSLGITNTSGSITTTTTGTTIWNDQMGCWHYTNYPEGFGYFTNSTLGKTTPEETKKQLLD